MLLVLIDEVIVVNLDWMDRLFYTSFDLVQTLIVNVIGCVCVCRIFYSGVAIKMNLKDHIRDIPDFPEVGILFRDITPLLREPRAFSETIDRLMAYYTTDQYDYVAGIESRGFLLAAPIAYLCQKPLVLIRKQENFLTRLILQNILQNMGPMLWKSSQAIFHKDLKY